MVSWHTTPGLSTSLTPYLQTVRRESRVTPGAPYSDKPSRTAHAYTQYARSHTDIVPPVPPKGRKGDRKDESEGDKKEKRV